MYHLMSASRNKGRGPFQVRVVWQPTGTVGLCIAEYGAERSNMNCSPLLYRFVINIIAVTVLVNCSSSTVSDFLTPNHDLYLLCLQFSAPACHRGMGEGQRSEQVAHGLE